MQGPLRRSARDKPDVGVLYDGSQLSEDGVFVFPDGSSKLVGRWNRDTGLLEEAVFYKGDQAGATYEFEDGFPGKHPVIFDSCSVVYPHLLVPNKLTACPYESQYVFVAQSSVGPKAGEGLFAAVDLPPSFLASYYSGEEVALWCCRGLPLSLSRMHSCRWISFTVDLGQRIATPSCPTTRAMPWTCGRPIKTPSCFAPLSGTRPTTV